MMAFKKIATGVLAITAYLVVAYFALGIKGGVDFTRTHRAENRDADDVATKADAVALMAACRTLLDAHQGRSETLVSETYAKMFPKTDYAKEPRMGTNIPHALVALKPAIIEIGRAPNRVVVRLRPHARNAILYAEHNSLTNELWYFNGCDSKSGHILLRRTFENRPAQE